MKDDDIMSTEDLFEGFEEVDLKPEHPAPVIKKSPKKPRKDLFAELKAKMVMRIYGVSKKRALEIIAGRAAEKAALEAAKDKDGRKAKNDGIMSAADFFGGMAG